MGQNHVPPQCDFFISDRKNIHFLTKPISKILTTSLESLYCQECSTNSDNSSIATIDIVVGGAISTPMMIAIKKHFEK